MRSLEIGLVLPTGESFVDGSTARWTTSASSPSEPSRSGSTPSGRPTSSCGARVDGPVHGWWECVAMTGAVAAATSRVKVGTWVLSALHRNPGITAKAVETLDEISGGRFVFGLGSGHAGRQAHAFGLPEDHVHGRFEEARRDHRPAAAAGPGRLRGDVPRGARPRAPAGRAAPRSDPDHDRRQGSEDAPPGRPPCRYLELVRRGARATSRSSRRGWRRSRRCAWRSVGIPRRSGSRPGIIVEPTSVTGAAEAHRRSRSAAPPKRSPTDCGPSARLASRRSRSCSGRTRGPPSTHSPRSSSFSTPTERRRARRDPSVTGPRGSRPGPWSLVWEKSEPASAEVGPPFSKRRIGGWDSSAPETLPGGLADTPPGRRPGRAGHRIQQHLMGAFARCHPSAFPGSTYRRAPTPSQKRSRRRCRRPATGSRCQSRSRRRGLRRAEPARCRRYSHEWRRGGCRRSTSFPAPATQRPWGSEGCDPRSRPPR